MLSIPSWCPGNVLARGSTKRRRNTVASAANIGRKYLPKKNSGINGVIGRDGRVVQGLAIKNRLQPGVFQDAKRTREKEKARMEPRREKNQNQLLCSPCRHLSPTTNPQRLRLHHGLAMQHHRRYRHFRCRNQRRRCKQPRTTSWLLL